MNKLGKLFKQIRSGKDWSIRQAAEKIGISHSYLSTLEKGIDRRTGKISIPRPDTLKLISKAYDYPYEELLKVAGYLHEDTSQGADESKSGFLLYSSLRDDIKKWLYNEDSIPYVKIAMKAQQNKISIESINSLIDSILTERKK